MLAFAYINHGRWLIDCPQCNTGWLVDVRNPHVLFDAQGGEHEACDPKFQGCGWRGAALFPREAKEIGALLRLRPELANQNWRPGESVADLRIENAAHKVGQAS